MHKHNYAAWHHLRQPQSNKSLAVVVSESLKAGILAPSTHNTQPWKLKVNDGGLTISPNYQLRLPAADPIDRGVFISLGCMITNLQVAAAAYGYQIDYEIHRKRSNINQDNYFQGITKTKNCFSNVNDLWVKRFELLIQVSFQKPTDDHQISKLMILGRLFENIDKRFSDKGKYLSQTVPNQVVNLINNYVRLFTKSQLKIISNGDTIKTLAQLYKKAAYEMSANQNFRRELSQWLRANNTQQADGMPGFVSGLPLLMSWLGPIVIRFFAFPLKIQSIKDAKNLQSAPALGLIASSENNILAWIQAGIAYQLVALVCRNFGISTTPMAALVENKNYPAFLQSFFRIPKLTPHMFFRLGYSVNREIHTPRRSVLEAINLP